MHRRVGKYQSFPWNDFCLTVLKDFVGEPFIVSLTLNFEKLYDYEGFVTNFCRKFLSRSTKKIVVEPFSVSLVSCIGTFYA